MRAYAMARQPPAGPVYLSVSMDDWKQPAAGPARIRTVSDRVAPDAERLELFAKRISASRRPALVFGPEVDRSGGWDAAIALAEKLRAAVYGAGVPGLDLPGLGISDVARGFGCRAVDVATTEELEQEFKTALTAGTTTVIVVRTQPQKAML
jgi:thiamine pyrophosphate-dependent acetolactate synthase large subunit-like protein